MEMDLPKALESALLAFLADEGGMLWFNTLLEQSPSGRPLLMDACCEAIEANDARWFESMLGLLRREAPKSNEPLALVRLAQACDTMRIAVPLHLSRLHYAVSALVATADAARLSLCKQASGDRLESARRDCTAGALPATAADIWHDEWLSHVSRRRGAHGEPPSAASLSLPGDIRHEGRGRTVAVPLAVVQSDVGMIVDLHLEARRRDGGAAALVPDIATALTPTAVDMVQALDAAWLQAMPQQVVWHLTRSSRVAVSDSRPNPSRWLRFLSGTSLQLAAALALRRMASGRHYPVDVVASASVAENGRLARVGAERQKLEAMQRLIANTRTSARGGAPSVLMLAADGDPGRWDDQFSEIDKMYPATLEEAQMDLDDAEDMHQRFLVDYSLRRFTAVLPPRPGEGWRVRVPSRSERMPPYLETRVLEFADDDRIDYRNEMRFSSSNVFDEECNMHYRALAPGSVLNMACCTPEEDNRVTTEEQQPYWDERKRFAFRYRPRPGGVYSLSAEVYGGFQRGNRDVHAHLWPNTRHRHVIFELDLRAFARDASGRWRLSDDPAKWPTLRVWRMTSAERQSGAMNSCGVICEKASSLEPSPHTPTSELGLWRWTIENVDNGGGVWLEWENTIEELRSITAPEERLQP